MSELVDRFLKLVSYDTKSDDNSSSVPTTDKQLIMAEHLRLMCQQIGLQEVRVSKEGYVYATLLSNCGKDAPVVGFIAHMDTSPDFSGENVKAKIIQKYDGKSIVLNKEKNIILSPDEFAELKKYEAQDLIVTDGTTLLGADDKAGIAEILTAMSEIIKDANFKHGTIKICFTPDEEVGKGADYFDVDYFGADYAYTLDGGEIGELEYENFNAGRSDITIKGKNIHPGYAKGIMKNAALIGSELAQMLPENETPATTEGYGGFYHLVDFSGNVEAAKLHYKIRSFDTDDYNKRMQKVKDAVAAINNKYGMGTATLAQKEEYRNMYEKVNEKPEVIEIAKKAMEQAGVTPIVRPIRGGTDGARLSFMGLACPNIFTGGHNFHGPYEFIPIQSMEKAVEVIKNIVSISTDGAATTKL